MINEQGRRFIINVAEDINALDKRLRQVEVNGVAFVQDALIKEHIEIPPTSWKESTFPFAAVNFSKEYKKPIISFQIVGGSMNAYANILTYSNKGAVVRTNVGYDSLKSGAVKITAIVSEG